MVVVLNGAGESHTRALPGHGVNLSAPRAAQRASLIASSSSCRDSSMRRRSASARSLIREERIVAALPQATVNAVPASEMAWSTGAFTTLVHPFGNGIGGETLRAGIWPSWELRRIRTWKDSVTRCQNRLCSAQDGSRRSVDDHTRSQDPVRKGFTVRPSLCTLRRRLSRTSCDESETDPVAARIWREELATRTMQP